MLVLFHDSSSAAVRTCQETEVVSLTRQLIDVLRTLREARADIALNSESGLSNTQVAPGWTLQRVLTRADYREEWQFIRTLVDRSPLVDGLPINSVVLAFHDCRLVGNSAPSVALTLAKVHGTATVSFAAQGVWHVGRLSVISSELDEQGVMFESTIEIRNFSFAHHVSEHRAWLAGYGLSSNPSASVVWAERHARFSGIDLAARVENDLRELESSPMSFQQALAALGELSRDVGRWPPGATAPDYSRKATPESTTRRRLCSAFDEFSGTTECFDWHLRFTGEIPGRIHFRTRASAKRITVAYVGRKLERPL